MRKNAPLKWLHAILDLLPVILIPVFMIYSHRHTIDSGSIDVPQNQVVDFNQLVINGDFKNLNDWATTGATLSIDDGAVIIASEYFGRVYQGNKNVYSGHKYYISLYASTSVVNYSLNGGFQFATNNGEISQNITSVSSYTWTHITNILACNTTSYNTGFYIWDTRLDNRDVLYLKDLFLVDLTQMFGSGNEPTLTQFNEWYPNEYYEYTLSHKELLKGTSTITYDDTDIMSQSMYQLYNAVDKYFNMNNIFNMGNVYDWFVLNIFSGNAPIIMYIVWNIALYELVMDLMFLLYALFMWFVDWCKSLIEKTYDTGRGK